MSDGDSENDRLVVDNGTWMCKAGWSGDKTARAYVPTIIGERHGSEVNIAVVGCCYSRANQE